MSYKSSNCIVLKSVNYQDADKIFTLYSREEGKISAIAKGVRKFSSKRAGSLDTLNLVSLTYFEGVNGHKTITEVKNLASFRQLKQDREKVEVAYKIIGLFLKHVEEDSPDPKLFFTLERTLGLLDAGEISFLAVISYFYINFMYSLGYKLQLKSCVICGEKLSKDWGSAWFSIEKGGLTCPSCKNFEEEIGLKGAALLNKLQVLREGDFKLFSLNTKTLLDLEKVLTQYVHYKLS